jgi:2-aminoadipate transaminase
MSTLPFSSKALRTTDSPISWLMAKAIEDPAMLSIAAGFVDTDTLPEDLVRVAMERVLADPKRAKAALQYGSTLGHAGLRQAMAKRLMAQGLTRVDPTTICISNGGQQALYSVTEVMVNPGDIVLVEDPTYFVYMDVLRASGARVIGVQTDAEGMVPAALEERFEELRRSGARDRVRILYVMSYFTNPKGCNPSRARRRQLHAIYTRENALQPFLMVEDASYRDLGLEGEDEPFIKSFEQPGDSIFLSGTFSKAFAPGVRLGWSHGPRPVMEAIARQKGNQDFGSSNLNQSLVAELLESGAYDLAGERFRLRYRAKRDALLAAIEHHWPADADILHPNGGLYVWARLPGIDTDPGSEFFDEVLAVKVLYVPGRYCYCDETQGERPRDAMRLCYGVADEAAMGEAIRRMGAVIERLKAPTA